LFTGLGVRHTISRLIKWTPSIPDIFMTWDVVLAAFAITTLGVVFCAVPIYCIVRSADLLGRLDRRASDNSRTVAAPLSPRDPTWGVVVNDGVLQFPVRRVPSQMDRAVLTEERVDQLAS
jgi:hypothetical protein